MSGETFSHLLPPLLLSLLLVAAQETPIRYCKLFDVKNYGAVADGKTDDAKAFENAWKDVCSWRGRAKLLVPEGRYLVGPLVLVGPCKGPEVVVHVRGHVLAPVDLKAYTSAEWISFRYVDGLLVTGRGKFDGQGHSVWQLNDCHNSEYCKRLPWSLNFSFVRNAKIQRITSINSKNVHMQIFACKNLKLDSIRLIAPGDSPNTDGIHLGESSNIEITSSVISTGDDCISIGPGTANLTVSNVLCGPGHGISIGSLGGGRNEGDVAGITVRNCTFIGTQNGVRIKTWAESPTSSAAHDFTFEDLIMTDVENPIVIDQKYCPHNLCGNKNPSLVKISNVKFRNIRGDTKTKNAIYLVCSDAFPCEGVELSNIDLRYNGLRDAAIASCANVRGQTLGSVFPPSCI
ncbi:hypothetical protein HPP92_021597 [Vanilla planifolia]|uniref:Exopolygalacturonase n=1 Tax=Vanilla planifolia TaxID=51239 RepID=A0A835UKW4_VANPL|nr:hypothetical protein HPP92_021597 [Vanilla planifolia]